MDLNHDNVKKIRGLIVFTAAALAAVLLTVVYVKDLGQALAACFGIISPFLTGAAIAFVLNIPLRAVEKTLFSRRSPSKSSGKKAEKFKRPISLVITLILVLLVISFVIGTVVPQLGKTFIELGNEIPVFFSRLVKKLELLFAENPETLRSLEEWNLDGIDWKSLLNSTVNFLKNGVGSMVLSTFNVASSIVSGVVNMFIAFVFAIYILMQKEKLGSQFRRLLQAYLPEKTNRRALKVCSLLYGNFSRFITGQCTEAVILGTMFFVTMTLFRFPYALLVGVLIAFTALIPIVGAFIGCSVGAFLILVDDPVMAVWFVALFLLLQQIEGNLIYPRVVGGSVGLPSMWVLAAVSIGGSLFGIGGMLVFIPLVSTVYGLLREDVNNRLAAEKKSEQKAEQKAEQKKACGGKK